MTAKELVEEGLAAEEIVVLVSLNVKCAFDATWWPRILDGLKGYNCPKKPVYSI